MWLDVSYHFSSFRIKDKFELKSIKLVLNGKTLSPGMYFFCLMNMYTLMCGNCKLFNATLCLLLLLDMRLDEQNVKNNSKVMVLKGTDPEVQKAMKETEEKNQTHKESVQRTKMGFQILSERGETMRNLYIHTVFSKLHILHLCI